MSKVVRNILIILLIVVLLGAVCWYFFIYRSGLPSHIYASYADFCESHGRMERAARFYAKASDLEPGDLELAIRTSDAYAACGNYTKAEFVLVRAISYNSDTLDGYLALSKVYVLQDKLLDAERLISACASERVKSELTALRPAAPVIQPEGGFSLEPTSASLSYGGGTAYYSVTEEYPTMADAPYDAPIELSYGVTTVSAIVVGDNGLLSPLATADFTVCGEICEVTFQSEEFDTFVRELLGKGRHADIMSTDLWTISELTVPAELTDLSDLSYFVGLKKLTLQSSTADDFSVLASLPVLETLDLTGTALREADLEAIGAITSLKELHLGSCGISSLDTLSSLSGLQIFDAPDNAITDISALAAMPLLEEVRLQNCSIAALSPLTTASALKILDISDNPVESLGALSANTALTELYAENCGISDLSPLENKTALAVLKASKNNIADISALRSCTALQELKLANNQISDLSPVLTLPQLTNLDVSSNLLVSSAAFADGSPLLSLNLSFNQLTEVTLFDNLNNLNYLNVNNNRLTDLSAIALLPKLIQVDALQNPIADASELEAHSIIVNYEPDFVLPEEETPEESPDETEPDGAAPETE